MNDLLYCESCGAEFELDEDVLLEDEDGNEYIECPECGELYEGFWSRVRNRADIKRMKRRFKMHGYESMRHRAEDNPPGSRRNNEKIAAAAKEKLKGLYRQEKMMSSRPPVKDYLQAFKSELKRSLKPEWAKKYTVQRKAGIGRKLALKRALGMKEDVNESIWSKAIRDRERKGSDPWEVFKKEHGKSKKSEVKEDLIDEMLEAIMDGYHPADVVDELMEANVAPGIRKGISNIRRMKGRSGNGRNIMAVGRRFGGNENE